MKKNIPNILTLTNLSIGLCSIIWAAQNKENLVFCSWLILIAMLFDFMDGKLARILNASSDFGKQLDSLADMISFGVAPAIIVFQLINTYNPHNTKLAYIALLIPICSALRLANFNIDQRQEKHFFGIPTPINALFFCSIPIIMAYEKNEFFLSFFSNVNFLFMATIIFSFLLISPLKTFSLKSSNKNVLEQKIKSIFIFMSIILFFLLKYTAFPVIVFFYIFLSIIFSLNKT
jgi:CDP-diacylglycerol---serine O-phosphatidyltransferase